MLSANGNKTVYGHVDNYVTVVTVIVLQAAADDDKLYPVVIFRAYRHGRAWRSEIRA